MRRAGIEIVGNATSAIRAFAKTGEAAAVMGKEIQGVSIKAEASAKRQVEASLTARRAIIEQIAAVDALAASYARGSRSQIAAANLGTRLRGQLGRNLASAEGEFASTVGRPGGITGGLRRLNQGVMGATGFGLRTVGVGTVGLGIFEAVKAAAGFQKTMNIFGSVSQATASQMRAASQEAIRLGNDIRLPATSASDAALAMTELSKAGLSVKDTIGAAQGVLQLSAAAEISNADAAAIAAQNLNAFHLKGTDAVMVADLLASAANSTSGNMTDMAEALTYTASSAAQAHIPIKDTVAAIAEMAQSGILGSQGGAAMQQMLLRLESPTKKASVEMKKLGISIYDQKGHMRGLPEIIAQFSEKTKGMSDAQRNAAMNSIFGARAIRAANIVLLGGVDAYERFRQGVSRQGAAADLAAARNKGLAGAWDGLKSASETLAIRIGTGMTPTLERWTRAIGNFLGNAHNQDRILKTLAVTAHMVGMAFKVLIPLVLFNMLRRAVLGVREFAMALRLLPVQAAPAILKTDAEIASMGTAATVAGGKVGLLRRSLMGLGALAIAPIVIPIVVEAGQQASKWLGKHVGHGFGDTVPEGFTLHDVGRLKKDLKEGKLTDRDREVAKALGVGNKLPNTSGMSNDPMHDAADRRATEAATGGGGSVGGAGAADKSKPYSLSDIQKIKLALSKNPNDVGAIKAKIAYDERAAAFAEKRIAEGRGTKTLVDQLQGVYADEEQLRGQLATLRERHHKDVAKAHKEASKRRLFTVPLGLQVAEARADALAGGQDGPTKLQIALAKQLKAAALKAIKSHHLSMQGLIDAWNAVAQANQTLAQKSKGESDNYKIVSTAALVAGMHLSGAEKKLLRERLAQRGAHGGTAPKGTAVEGQMVTIDTVHVHGVKNVDEFFGELEKVRRKRRTQRSGRRT